MSFVKCFDAASMVIEDANERFTPIWKVDADKLNIFKQYCEAIDLLSKEFNGEAFEVEVDEHTMEISVTLECDEIIIESNTHILYELVQRTIKYGFSASGDNLLVSYVFPSIWSRA